MPCITLPVDANFRPTLEIGISAAASLQQKGVALKIHWFPAIADTGCSHTCIHADVAAVAGLQVVGKGTSNTANGQVAMNLFYGDLFMRVTLPNGQAYEYPMRNRRFGELCTKIPDVDALLGMDVLMQGTFHVNGLTRNAIFCW
jgi:hypothetical protein